MFEFVSDHIRVNLTRIAQKVLESDCIIFGASANNQLTYGALVNKIIENFDDNFILNENLLTHPCDSKSRVIRLQNDVIDLLGEVSLDKYLKNTSNPSVPKYVRCLLESFVRLPFIEREKLYLKDIIHNIETALSASKNLHITYEGKVTIITPITIATAKEGTFLYLVGNENSSVISIRLSRIEKIRVAGKSNPIPKITRDQIDADLFEFGATFVAEPKVIIKVRFSQKGEESYKYSVIHRPLHIDKEHGNTYVFYCSETQALFFFFRFAGDVEILEPQSLRDKMRERYQAGLNKYM